MLCHKVLVILGGLALGLAAVLSRSFPPCPRVFTILIADGLPLGNSDIEKRDQLDGDIYHYKRAKLHGDTISYKPKAKRAELDGDFFAFFYEPKTEKKRDELDGNIYEAKQAELDEDILSYKTKAKRDDYPH